MLEHITLGGSALDVGGIYFQVFVQGRLIYSTLDSNKENNKYAP